jgi:flagellar motor switch protein FliG
MARRRETVANILAATDAKTRCGIVQNLKKHNATLAQQLSRSERESVSSIEMRYGAEHYASMQEVETTENLRRGQIRKPEKSPVAEQPAQVARQVAAAPLMPRIDFDQLDRLDTPTLAALLRDVDAHMLAIALAGSDDALVDKICAQMPKRIGRSFRRELRKIGPTRLSDIEGAQRIVAEAAARHLARRRPMLTTA